MRMHRIIYFFFEMLQTIIVIQTLSFLVDQIKFLKWAGWVNRSRNHTACMNMRADKNIFLNFDWFLSSTKNISGWIWRFFYTKVPEWLQPYLKYIDKCTPYIGIYFVIICAFSSTLCDDWMYEYKTTYFCRWKYFST